MRAEPSSALLRSLSSLGSLLSKITNDSCIICLTINRYFKVSLARFANPDILTCFLSPSQ